MTAAVLFALKRIGAICLFGCSFVQIASAQTCKVLDPAIESSYSGDCRNGLAHGIGKAAGRDSYQGSFEDGLPHGYGTYQWGAGSHASGDLYVGMWQRGKQHGVGRYARANGVSYEGSFVDGSKGISGQWTVQHPDTKQALTCGGEVDCLAKIDNIKKVAGQLGKAAQSPDARDSKLFDEAKTKCAELGFKTGTEDFGKCVLQLSR